MSGDLPERTLLEDLRSDVHDIMSDAVRWRLPHERWAAIEDQTARVLEALRTDDLVALRAALGELEVAAPLRITPIGGEPTFPATSRLRGLATQVVHDLGEGIGPHERRSADERADEGGRDDATGR